MVQQLPRGALLLKHAGQQARNTPIILLAGIVVFALFFRDPLGIKADALHVKDC